MDDADEQQAQEPRKLDGRKLALIGMAAAVVVFAAIAGAFAWKSHKQKVDETAVVAAVADTTLMLREVLAKPAGSAELAPRMDQHLTRIKAATRTPASDAAEEYVLGAREIARKRSDVQRLARQASASRDAAFAHLAAGKRREGAWFKTASELKRRMERDYTELNISLKTLDTLYSGMPESVKRAGPLFGPNTLVSSGEFQAAAAQTQEELKRVALEVERARQLPLN